MNSSKRRTTRKMGSGKIAFGAFSSGLVVCDRGTPDFLVPYSTCRCVQSIQLQDTIDEIRNVRWDVTRPSSSRRTDTGFKPMSPNWDERHFDPGDESRRWYRVRLPADCVRTVAAECGW